MAIPNRSSWIALTIGAAVAVAVIAVVVQMWVSLGDVSLSPAGWAALVLGVVLALALGIGLMALVFISNRRGFDEPDGDPR